MLRQSRIAELERQSRFVDLATTGDEDLGPLQLLPGQWKNTPDLAGRGWNMIALPFSTQPNSAIDYRIYLNQFNEELNFTLVDKAVPNRGVRRNGASTNTDQFVVALDYEQVITQVIAEDFPVSGLAAGAKAVIHHEPGLWLHMANEVTNDVDTARLGTIPHGDSVLALGTHHETAGAPMIPAINGLPIGVNQDLNNPYLGPYKHFNDDPFKGNVTAPGFPGFNPVEPHLLLAAGVPPNIVKNTVLEVQTAVETAGIVNIPFIVKQANATEMNFTMWIEELAENDAFGNPRLILQYAQVVFLEFFARKDGQPGLIKWPHVSINTMEKVAEPSLQKVTSQAVI